MFVLWSQRCCKGLLCWRCGLKGVIWRYWSNVLWVNLQWKLSLLTDLHLEHANRDWRVIQHVVLCKHPGVCVDSPTSGRSHLPRHQQRLHFLHTCTRTDVNTQETCFFFFFFPFAGASFCTGVHDAHRRVFGCYYSFIPRIERLVPAWLNPPVTFGSIWPHSMFNPPVTFLFTDIFYPRGQFDPSN